MVAIGQNPVCPKPAGAYYGIQEIILVPRVGVEPTLPKEPDFESSASANSAIWAQNNSKKSISV